MAQSLKRNVEDAHDETSVLTPDVKDGDIAASNYVLRQLGTKANNPVSEAKTGKDIIPNVTGMGARDAVYQLESRGVKARLRGRGRVKSQSIYAGTVIKQGMVCELVLE